MTKPEEDTLETRLSRRRGTQPIETRDDRALLIVLVGGGAGRSHLVDRDVTIGRSSTSDICLLGADVSREHAQVRLDGGSFLLEDLDSANGTLVNGIPVDSQYLQFGDKIRIGGETLLLFTRYDRLEDQLLQSQRLETLGQLASGVAHDFNNILGASIGNIGFIRGLDPGTPIADLDVQGCLDDLDAAMRRAADLTGQLLGLVRRDRGAARELNLHDAVDEVVRMMRRTLTRSVALRHDVGRGLAVRMDPVQLNQALTNLCINARDAMPGGGVIDISASRVEISSRDVTERYPMLSPGAHVHLVVRDAGEGMDPEVLKNAFEPFYTTKHRGKGTGLGLSTVLSIVQAHSGHVELESVPGHGTGVHIYLPSVEIDPELATEDFKFPPLSEKALGGAMILLVDDEPLVLSSIKRTLGRLGHSVRTAVDGLDALRVFEERGGAFDLVLLDMNMPNLDGRDTFIRLREMDPAARVLLISGQPDQSSIPLLLDRGAAGFLPKPFDQDGLNRAIAEALSK